MGIFVDNEELYRNVKECTYMSWLKTFRALLIIAAITFSVTYILLLYQLEIVITGKPSSFSIFHYVGEPSYSFNFMIHFPGINFALLSAFELTIVAYFYAHIIPYLYLSPATILYILITGCYKIYTEAERDNTVILGRLLFLLIITVTQVWTYFCACVYHDILLGIEKKNVPEEKNNVPEDENNISKDENTVSKDDNNVSKDMNNDSEKIKNKTKICAVLHDPKALL